MTMRMRQPEGSGRGSGPGMRDTDDEPKRYIGLRYPESFVQKIRLADYIRGCIEERVERDVVALARRLNDELSE